MAVQTINYGTETAFTVTNINSLANNAAKPIGVVDNSTTKALDYRVYLEVSLNTTGVSATGSLEIYLIESSESTTADFSDGIDPAGTADVSASIKNAPLLAILNANANSQIVRAIIDIGTDLRGLVRNCPKFWSVVVLNKSGAAILATGNEASYTAIKSDIA